MKPTFQDIIPPDKRSIRNIPLDKKHRTEQDPFIKKHTKKNQEKLKIEKEEVIESSLSKDFTEDYEDILYEHNPPKIILWIIAIASVVGLVFAVSLLFSRATVYVTVHSYDVALDHQAFIAIPSTADIFTSTGTDATSSQDVSFQIITIEDTKSMNVPASGSTTVSIKSIGNVIIYNNYNKIAQSLVATTRLQTSDGRIYRLVNGVTVPGQSIVGGKLQAGSVNASIIADQPGAEYNISQPQDLTVVGFKGTPKYAGFIATTKGLIAGGQSGEMQKVAPEDMARATSSIEKDLTISLQKRLISQVPDSFTLYKNTMSISFEIIPNVLQTATSPSGTAVVTEKATARAIIFNTVSLVRAIAATSSTNITGTKLDSLDFEIATSSVLASSTAPIAFTLTGTTSIQDTFSNEMLKNDLRGLSKADAQKVFEKYGLLSAEAVIRPFWKSSFPDSPDKIVIQKLN